MCAHAVLRLAHHPTGPSSPTFEPCYMMEDAIEHFFGRLKTIRKETGTPTVGTALQAAQLLHARQKRKPGKAGNGMGWNGSKIFKKIFKHVP